MTLAVHLGCALNIELQSCFHNNQLDLGLSRMFWMGFRHIALNVLFGLYTLNEAHKQYCLLVKIFSHIFYLGPPGTHLYLSPQSHYMPAGEAGRHVAGVHDVLIDYSLEVQDNRYSQMLYLVDHIAYGLHS